MLDVHPAPHAAHSWREFFIHIATIVVGLLIAVSLEQTVEWFHHRNERQHLEEDLRAEAEHNINTIDLDNRLDMAFLRWLTATVAALRGSQSQAGKISITIPPYQDQHGTNYHAPSWGVWVTAKTDGTSGLMPSQEAQVYSRLDFVAERATDASARTDAAQNQIGTLELRLGVHVTPGEHLELKPTDRDELVQVLSTVATAEVWQMMRYAIWADTSEAILRNGRSVDEVSSYGPRRDALARQLAKY